LVEHADLIAGSHAGAVDLAVTGGSVAAGGSVATGGTSVACGAQAAINITTICET